MVSPALIRPHGTTLDLYHLDLIIFSPEMIMANIFLFLSKMVRCSIYNLVVNSALAKKERDFFFRAFAPVSMFARSVFS